MRKHKARLWNAVRSLQGKKDKLPVGSQDDSDPLYFANIEELESEPELEKRVRQWQAESCHPREYGSPPAYLKSGQIQGRSFQVNQQVGCAMGDVDNADAGVLYHPDFADWASIHHDQTQGSWSSSHAQAGADDIAQVLDEAKASLSRLLGAPFCTNR
jgi:hypothetical protein